MVGFHAFRNCAAVYWGMIKQVRFYRAVSNVKCCKQAIALINGTGHALDPRPTKSGQERSSKLF